MIKVLDISIPVYPKNQATITTPQEIKKNKPLFTEDVMEPSTAALKKAADKAYEKILPKINQLKSPAPKTEPENTLVIPTSMLCFAGAVLCYANESIIYWGEIRLDWKAFAILSIVLSLISLRMKHINQEQYPLRELQTNVVRNLLEESQTVFLKTLRTQINPSPKQLQSVFLNVPQSSKEKQLAEKLDPRIFHDVNSVRQVRTCFLNSLEISDLKTVTTTKKTCLEIDQQISAVNLEVYNAAQKALQDRLDTVLKAYPNVQRSLTLRTGGLASATASLYTAYHLTPSTTLLQSFSMFTLATLTFALPAGVIVLPFTAGQAVTKEQVRIAYGKLLELLKTDMLKLFTLVQTDKIKDSHKKISFIRVDSLSPQTRACIRQLMASDLEAFNRHKTPEAFIQNLKCTLIDLCISFAKDRKKELNALYLEKTELQKEQIKAAAPKNASSLNRAPSTSEKPLTDEQLKRLEPNLNKKKYAQRVQQPPTSEKNKRPVPDTWPPKKAHQVIKDFAGYGIDVSFVFDEKKEEGRYGFDPDDKNFTTAIYGKNWQSKSKKIANITLAGKGNVYSVRYAKLGNDKRILYIPEDALTHHQPIILYVFDSTHESQDFKPYLENLSFVSAVKD